MKKMPTIFKREFTDEFGNRKKIKTLNEINPECQWVFDREGYATEKIDGTCCLIENNVLFARYDFKPGRTLPEGAIPCQEKGDPITGHFPHWVPTADNPNYKWYNASFHPDVENYENGTYELIGKHFNSNPYNLTTDIFVAHGKKILDIDDRSYEGINNFLKEHEIEGIVFYHPDGRMAKIKRSDFGFEWPIKKEKTNENV